jgi:DNA-binding protein HU-beta
MWERQERPTKQQLVENRGPRLALLFNPPSKLAPNQKKEPSNMNTSDLVDAVAGANQLSKADAKRVVDSVFEAIAGAAANGDEIAINGFGKFKVKASPAREGRNPATGAAMTIAASRKLGFSPAKAIKDKLNG